MTDRRRPAGPIDSGEAQVLEYLREIGFEELALRRGRAATDTANSVSSADSPPGPERLGGGRGPSEESAGTRAEALERLEREASGCTLCRLAEGRKNVVFADGDPDAELMFIGEGPGSQEDLKGLPFVGPAGQLLDRIIQAMDMRRQDVYIANIVKCRPPGNRDPEEDEVAACGRYLQRQVELVAPKALVALGRVAAQTLLGTSSPLGRLRGSWHEVSGVPLRVTYHPAALLRNASFKRPTWEDMQAVMERLRSSEVD